MLELSLSSLSHTHTHTQHSYTTQVCEANRLDVRTAVCFLFKVRRNSALFEEGASRLKNLLFDPSSSQHEAFDDCYFYLPQLLHIALNSKLHTAALERIMLRMCLTTKQTRENLRSIRFALMMFWYVFTYLLFFSQKGNTHTHNTNLTGYFKDTLKIRNM